MRIFSVAVARVCSNFWGELKDLNPSSVKSHGNSLLLAEFLHDLA